MKNRYFWIFVGIAFFLFIIPVTISFYRDYQVYKNGKAVEVTITYLPSNYTSKSEFMRFSFNEVGYDKKVSSSFSRSHKIGEKIYLKYLPGYENNFLFLDESPIFWGALLNIILMSAGLWSFYYAYKKQTFIKNK